ncbi:hypothetical protein N9261_00135 [bacterium]|nr:hypothetical protein [bacterium]
MLQNLRALTLLILALPGLILTPASGFVICLCSAGPSAPAAMSCCEAPPAAGTAGVGEAGCDVDWLSSSCCGHSDGSSDSTGCGDCGSCFEVELDEVLLASVDSPSTLLGPAAPVAMALECPELALKSLRGSNAFIRPPPPQERPNAGLLPGVRPLRI